MPYNRFNGRNQQSTESTQKEVNDAVRLTEQEIAHLRHMMQEDYKISAAVRLIRMILAAIGGATLFLWADEIKTWVKMHVHFAP